MKDSIVIVCKKCGRKIRHMEKVIGRTHTRICPECGKINDIPRQ